mmetsp:Transcript_19592/g.26891  ORF Transcript_19592/g.26891 Transcript_19592/m.26891 type:complete len:115 (-) Transcript_19592:89-433(-)
MSKCLLNEWMTEQAKARNGHHNVIVVLSDNYWERVKMEGSGVHPELTCVVESMEHSKVNEHVIAVGLDGQFNDQWKSNKLIEKLTKSFVYPLQRQDPMSVLTIVERVFGSLTKT